MIGSQQYLPVCNQSHKQHKPVHRDVDEDVAVYTNCNVNKTRMHAHDNCTCSAARCLDSIQEINKVL